MSYNWELLILCGYGIYIIYRTYNKKKKLIGLIRLIYKM